MDTVRTAEQIRAEHIQVLGAELGEVYSALYQDAVWLHFEWQQYRKLFGQSEADVHSLNEAAGAFFWLVETALWENVVLGIARMTETASTRSQDNLTLRRLPVGATPAIALELKAIIQEREPSWKFATEWRHKRLAHRDLDVALGRRATPLTGVSRQDIEGALAAIRDILNTVEKHYFNSEVHYDLHEVGDADAVLHYLRKGVAAEDAEDADLLRRAELPE